MKTFADRKGSLAALYRSATESVHRDIYLLTSTAELSGKSRPQVEHQRLSDEQHGLR
jgi:hypothetical protein